MRRVHMIMGMPASIDIPDAVDPTVFIRCFDYLRLVDATFSTYRNDSEVSQFNQNMLTKDQLSSDVLDVYRQCQRYEKLTSGYFSAAYAGAFDPSGLVKTWAMQRVATMITSFGYSTFLINIAGDIIGAGRTRSWNIAIQDPFDANNTLGVVALHMQSIATSGSYTRGTHIINPLTRLADSDLISVSVYGDDAVTADVYATTCIAMGIKRAIVFLQTQPGYKALLIEKDGTTAMVNGFEFAKMQIAQ